jgi:hypothetical protein
VRVEHDTPFKGPPPSEPLRLGGHRVRERCVGSLVAQRVADYIETPSGEIQKPANWTDGRVTIEPRHGFIEITYRQLHLFSRSVVHRNREQHFSLSPPGVKHSV